MPKKQTLGLLFKKIQRLPLEITVPVAVIIGGGLLYLLLFSVERGVAFSYSGQTCVRQLTLLPGLHTADQTSGYAVKVSDKLELGGVTLASLSTCFMPTEPPKQGTTKVSVAPFGGLLARKTYSLTIGDAPTARLEVLDKPVPISRPLKIELSGSDTIFSYELKVGEGRVTCAPVQAEISCPVADLELTQGSTYTAELIRSFEGVKAASVAKKDIVILPATKVTDSSVKPGETVYARPKAFTATFDKKITKVVPMLVRIEGDKRTKLPLGGAKVTGTTVEMTLPEELPRSSDYELTLEGVVASDGSSLEEAYSIPFKTSGGPKVSGVNVGSTGVPVGTTVVISFDQPLSEKQDIAKFVTPGGGAVFAGKRGNQVLISLANVPKCGDFSIKLTNDLQSNYDIPGNSAWSFSGRTVCHTIGTIGYSSKGRAINAYYFGNGSRTVLFTGAIHGSERSTKSLMDRWIQELEANARKIPADKQIVVVPAINPDGLAAGSRTNARNVDLNRNFGTSDWRSDVTDVNNRPFPGGGGPSPMSEPETNVIASFVQRIRPIVVLSYHSIGGLVAANQAGGSVSYASAYSQLSGYRNTTGQTGDTFEYGISGTADDWYAERLGVASVLVELGSHSYHQFERNQKAMWHMVGL